MASPWRYVLPLGGLAALVIAVLIIRDGLGTPSLLAAVQENDVAALTRILDRRPELVTTQVMPQGSRSRTNSRIRWRGLTVMHQTISITGGRVAIAEALRAHGADLDVRVGGDTLLHFAVEDGDIAMMEWLLAQGAAVDAVNGCEHPPWALCPSGQHENLLSVERGEGGEGGAAHCPGCTREGQTPLHAAARAVTDEATALLLEKGADVHATDATGRTPLHYAAEATLGDTARLLCAHGADPSRRDRAGKTPHDQALAADAAGTVERFSQTGPGELAGWLAPAGGCAQVAARAQPGAPVPREEVNAAWRAYACTRDRQWCA